MKHFFLRSPSNEDIIRLLTAWRIWLAGALIGGLVGLLFYIILPPDYRAQATILVDFNVEDVIPQEETDRNRFYYLQQESDKLVEIAWSDAVLLPVSSQTGVSLEELRGGTLRLSQPGDGGWNFLADSRDPQVASALASAWAGSFYQALQSGQVGVAPTTESALSVSGEIPVERSIPTGVYIFCGTLFGVAGLALAILFVDRNEKA
ncbi:MAG: hypothetical protein HY781_11260 [Chloroflexi bacterium]|nr:hypothetical protein [Chloroflexota bacterium]